MKYFLLFFSLIILSTNLFSQHLNNPESVVYDIKNNRYLVSNADISTKNGEILSLDPVSHEVSSFISDDLSSPKGLTIVENRIYCTDITSVKGFDLLSGKMTLNIPIKESIFLNDITSDGKILFISDNVANKIFSINISTGIVRTLVNEHNLTKPNGLLYNKKSNKIIICSFKANSPIQSYDLNLNLLSTIVETDIGQLDGITIDQNGNYYISSWNDNAIYKFDPLFSNPPEQISNGHYGPADIFYDMENNILAIPNFNSNTVNLLKINPNDDKINVNPYSIKIYPNPTSDLFSIYFKLDYQVPVSIQIINKSGKTIYKLENEYQPNEYQKIKIDSKNIGLTKGIFFIKIIIDEDVFMKRIAIID